MHQRLPEWIRTKHSPSELHGLKKVLREHGVSSVCEEARCPNKAHCFARPTAAFMILGCTCTRRCGFCAVDSQGELCPPDPGEPRRVALASSRMGLRHVVITSVTRDDLDDGGAGHFAATIMAVKEAISSASVEVLIPDFKGDQAALRTVLDAGPDVFNHNVETVPSLYGAVRPQADYRRSLSVLRDSKRIRPSVSTKSGLMLGLGEEIREVREVLEDLREAGCDLLTIGQYMRPGRGNLPVRQYVRPEVFDMLKAEAEEMGFRFVASSPLVRSSMNAEEMYNMEIEVRNV